MESLVGIVIFLVFVAFSAVAKSQAQKDQQRRRQARGQQWPGPVAGPGPNMGFPIPRPQVPPFQPTPFPQPQPQPVRPAPALAPAPVGEGVGMEGPLSESTEAEVSRFERETAQDIESAVSEVTREASEFARAADALAGSNPGSRNIGQLSREEYAPPGLDGEAEGASVRLDDLQQAVVMAEVLGRPKGVRYFRRSR